MLGMFLEAISPMTHSASSVMVTTDPAGIDHPGRALQPASTMMHQNEPKSVRMTAPPTRPRICATVGTPSPYERLA